MHLNTLGKRELCAWICKYVLDNESEGRTVFPLSFTTISEPVLNESVNKTADQSCINPEEIGTDAGHTVISLDEYGKNEVPTVQVNTTTSTQGISIRSSDRIKKNTAASRSDFLY